MSATLAVETWTVLCERSDDIRAVISHERGRYAVRDVRGRVVGRFATLQQAIAGLPAEA